MLFDFWQSSFQCELTQSAEGYENFAVYPRLQRFCKQQLVQYFCKRVLFGFFAAGWIVAGLPELQGYTVIFSLAFLFFLLSLIASLLLPGNKNPAASSGASYSVMMPQLMLRQSRFRTNRVGFSGEGSFDRDL